MHSKGESCGVDVKIGELYLEEEERYEGEHGDEGEEVSGGLALGEGVVRRRVADQEDGDGRQPDVRHQVLVVARLRPDLERSSSLQHLLLIHC